MTGPLVPVAPPPRPILEDLPGFCDPLEALRRVRHRRHPVLLLSGLMGHHAARFSILAWDPVLVVAIRGGEALLVGESDGRRSVQTRPARDPFALLRALAPAGAIRRTAPGVPFIGGAIGYLGYGLRRSIERLPPAPPDPLGQPDAWFGLYDRAVVFDHLERRVILVATGLGAENERQRLARAAAGLEDLASAWRARLRRGPRLPPREPSHAAGLS